MASSTVFMVVFKWRLTSRVIWPIELFDQSSWSRYTQRLLSVTNLFSPLISRMLIKRHRQPFTRQIKQHNGSKRWPFMDPTGVNGEWTPRLEPFSDYGKEEKRAKFYAGEKEYIEALQREKAPEGGLLFLTQQQDWHDSWYVCMYVCICVCMCVCMCMCACMYVCICVCVCMHNLYVCMYMYGCRHVHMYIFIHVCTQNKGAYIHTCVHNAYIPLYIHIHVYTSLHTYIIT
jgi:hypothetical protein